MTRTTPPRPVDLAAIFPEMAAFARTATRLHPRPGAPGVHDSSVGGPLLWPADEPWPVCEQEHPEDDVQLVDVERRRRRLLAAAWARTRQGERFAITEEERAELDRLTRLDEEADSDAPTPMLAVAQFYLKDVPDLAAPYKRDVLQVLWCPRNHVPEYLPEPVLRWRRASDVTEVLAEQPEPEVMEYGYLPDPCVLHPERVVEYPYIAFHSDDLRKRIRAWEEKSGHWYGELSIAPGWKAGGHASWALSDPSPMVCDCGADMELLLAIDSGERDGSGFWRPVEDAASEGRSGVPDAGPTQVSIGRGYALWIFVCPASPDHGFDMATQ